MSRHMRHRIGRGDRSVIIQAINAFWKCCLSTLVDDMHDFLVPECAAITIWEILATRMGN